METGTVKFFDSRDNKRFGFILMENGEDLFFHFNDGQCVLSGAFKPRFQEGRLMREPRKGDRLVFETKSARKGYKAAPWGYEEDYERAKKECRSVQDPVLLSTYPFLSAVLEKACGYKDGGPFEVRTAGFTPELFQKKGMEWHRAGVDSRFYLVMKPKGDQFEIQKLDSESWWSDGIDEGHTDAQTLGEQMKKKGLAFQDLAAIVEVDTSQTNATHGWSYLGREQGEEQRITTVYTP